EHGAGLDLASWHALQEWLAAGECRVDIPYARPLLKAIPGVAVRLRRDIGALLDLVRAHALLHRATRKRDSQDRVVATIGDYAAVYRLVSELIAQGVGATVPKTIRETVMAVERVLLSGEKEATVTAVAREMKLEPSAAWRRVQATLEKGYLRNNEDRK